MIKRLFIYVVLSFFLSASVSGNTFFITKKLVWNDSIANAPSCNGCIRDPQTGNIPFISDIFEINNNDSVRFEISSITQGILDTNLSKKLNSQHFLSNIAIHYTYIKASAKTYVRYSFPAIYSNDSNTYSIKNIIIKVTATPNLNLKNGVEKSSVSTTKSSVLASGNWYKFQVTKNSIYKITAQDLAHLGIPVSRSVRVFTGIKHQNNGANQLTLNDDLTECSIFYSDGGDGVFNGSDYLLFYGENSYFWNYDSTASFFNHISNSYSINNYYYLLVDGGLPEQIKTFSSTATPDYEVTTFDNYDYHKNDQINVLHSGQEWVETIPSSPITFSLQGIDALNSNIKIGLFGQSTSSYDMPISINNANSTVTIPSSSGDYVSVNKVLPFKTISGNVSIGFPNSSLAQSSNTYLDYIVVNTRSPLNYNNTTLLFRDAIAYKIARNPTYMITATKNITVWNVSDALHPIQLTLSQNATTYNFVYPSTSLEEFASFDDGSVQTPQFIGNVSNQNLHACDPVDMVILAADDFVSQANELKNLHENLDGLQSIIVTQQQVYNEFSGGRIDPDGLKNFMRYLYEKDNKKLKFLLLFGDGSYDNRDYSFKDQIITFESSESTQSMGSYVSDDYFGTLDVGENITSSPMIYGLDIDVGRLPVDNTNDANIITKKIIGYATASRFRGAYRNKIIFLADDADASGETEFMIDASDLASTCLTENSSLIVDKIYLDAYQEVSLSGGQRYPTVNTEIESQIKNGCLLFNYTGHANQLRLASEVVIDAGEVDKWENEYALPVFITAGCEVGRFDDPSLLSLGEYILLSNHGGGIALITSTREVYESENQELNKNVCDYMFNITPEGKPQYIGEVVKNAKNKTGNDINKLNFTLLGDPALRLAMPVYNVVTDKINGVDISTTIDTLKALAPVSIEGHIEDGNGIFTPAYTGYVDITVFDKPQTVESLNNDGNGAVSFQVQSNILFKGTASVKNGKFTANFIMPKDIFYYYGIGRISYYSDNGVNDGTGSFSNFVIGGFSGKSLLDSSGPDIHLYMNDTSFVNGGITDPSPNLLVKTSDDYGINVSGTSVGHDATAIFDNGKSNEVVLNEFYEADTNTYKSGLFKYPVSQLSDGEHTVDVTVWNINNNMTEATLNFIVQSSSELALRHVFNYPNPLVSTTNFSIEQNQKDQEFAVTIQIFTITGNLVKTLSTTIFSEGNRLSPIEWDGTDENGNVLSKGVYVYRVIVTNESSQKAFTTEKLLILK